MKTIDSIFAVKDEVVSFLTLAGFKRGLELTEEQISNEVGIIFWPIHVKSSKGSSKQTYITYNVVSSTPYSYTDGEVNSRAVVCRIEVFSRNREVLHDLKVLENAFESNSWSFELVNADYDADSQQYIYTFETQALVND